MKILFHSNALTKRGDSVTVSSYAKALNLFYGYDCKIVFDVNNTNNSKEVISSLISSGFDIYGYKNLNDLNIYAHKLNVDVVYWLKSGENDNKYLKDCKNVIHAVFNQVAPHGDVYAYVSEWLAITASKNYANRSVNVFRNLKNIVRENFSPYSLSSTYKCAFSNLFNPFEFVPHIIDLPNSQVNFRSKYGISDRSFLIGRIGGYTEFNIPFVKNTIETILNDDLNNIFIFVNTEPFITHNRVIFINNYIDEFEKSSFISACDMMLHARSMGESFGISIAESLSLNIPVASCIIGHDKNHHSLLNSTGLLYQDSDELMSVYSKIKSGFYKSIDLRSNVLLFTPEKVSEKFKEVFLS